MNIFSADGRYSTGYPCTGIEILDGYNQSRDYKSVCFDAKKFANLDGMNINHKVYDSRPYYFDDLPEGRLKSFYAKKCDTIPVSFVRYDVEDKTVKIMIRRNLFEDEKFTIEVEKVKSTPVPRPDILTGEYIF